MTTTMKFTSERIGSCALILWKQYPGWNISTLKKQWISYCSIDSDIAKKKKTSPYLRVSGSSGFILGHIKQAIIETRREATIYFHPRYYLKCHFEQTSKIELYRENICTLIIV